MRDFDDLSTSAEEGAALVKVLSKRQRRTGQQYLVVYAGFTDDDAKWIPEASIAASADLQLVRTFEESIVAQQFVGSSDIDSSSEGDLSDEEALRLNFTGDEEDADDGSDDEDDDDDILDEKDLIERRVAKMTDEQIARLLAKQEELGLGSDELVLFHETAGFDDGSDDLEAETFLDKFIKASASKQKSKRGKRTKTEFPSASLMADVLDQDPYNGFDVMDFDRPSLRKKVKGRQGALPVELSDEELEANLREVWEADRKTKRQKKLEREELRAQGLLGKKNKFKADLKMKYSEGMSMVQIKDEIRQFLSSTHDR